MGVWEGVFQKVGAKGDKEEVIVGRVEGGREGVLEKEGMEGRE